MRDGYKMTKLGEIPIDWEVATIDDVTDVCTGGKDTQDKVEGGTYPFFVRSNTIERINSYSFEGEAVLTSGDGVGVGKIYHYLNKKFEYHQRVYNIHNFSSILSGKFFYFYFSQHFYSRVMRLSAKNSVDSVRRSMITEMNIPLPPIQEQQKIAKILTTVDEKTGIIQEQIQETQTLKKGLMQRLLIKGIGHTDFKESKLGVIPVDWEVGTCSSIGLEYIDGDRGTNYPKSHELLEKGYCLFLSAKNVTKNGFKFIACQFISEEKDKLLRKGKLKLDDMIITTRGSVGHIALYDSSVPFKQIRLNSGMVIMRDSELFFDKVFLYQLMNSPIIKNQIELMTSGSAQPQLTIKGLKQLKLPIVPMKEQQKIGAILSSVGKKLAILKEKKANYQELKKGLMQQLLTGNIRVKTER